MAKRQISYCRFRLAQLGRAGIPSIVLVFIGLMVIGCLTKHLESDSANNQERKPMKIKISQAELSCCELIFCLEFWWRYKMILSDKSLKELMVNKELLITPYSEEQLGPTSIDLHLGHTIVKYTCECIDLKHNVNIYSSFSIPLEGYTIFPGEFILATTYEKVKIPNGYQGFIETKGSIARAGLQVHNTDGHIDPGSNHVITLEIVNNNNIPIILYPEIAICQIFIFKLTTLCNQVYCGKYLGQTEPTTYIP